MKFSEIAPFGRYIRYLKITESSNFGTSLPIDCRLFYVKKGEGRVEIDGKELVLPTGSLLYINSFVPYTLLKSNVKYLAINFDFTNSFSHIAAPIPPVPLDKKASFSPLEKIKFEDAPCFDRFLFIENAVSMLDIFESAEREFTEKPPFYAMRNSSQITDILTRLYRKNELGGSGEKLFDAKKISEYIRENLTDDISNKTLAEHFHFHPNYLSNQFCRHYGKPVHSYILEMRIMKAISLLEAGNSNISDIAAKVGFTDRNYFSRYFKKITGTSPKAYLSKNMQ